MSLSRSTPIFRFLFLLAIAGLLAFVTRMGGNDFSNSVQVALWIYALIVAFLIDKALTRRTDLKDNIAIELTRLRHIHHVAENFPSQFKRSIDIYLEKYQLSVANDFGNYRKGNKAFRTLSHAIYGYTPKSEKEKLLYVDLLQTLQDLTLGRQHIMAALQNHLAPYYWVLIISLFLGLLIVYTLPGEFTVEVSFIASWIVIFSSFIPLEMLWRSDHQSYANLTNYGRAYRKNVPGALEE